MSDDAIPPEACWIKTIERKDGVVPSRVLIFSRHSGAYQFGIMVDWEDEAYAWSQMDQVSGLYGSAEEAERAARQEIRWLSRPEYEGK